MRLLLKCFCWAVFLRWIYAEMLLVAPFLVPYVDSALHYVQIPTHDSWPAIELVSSHSESAEKHSENPDDSSVTIRLSFLEKLPEAVDAIRASGIERFFVSEDRFAPVSFHRGTPEKEI